jgi:hypothetical protein
MSNFQLVDHYLAHDSIEVDVNFFSNFYIHIYLPITITTDFHKIAHIGIITSHKAGYTSYMSRYLA